MSLGNRSALATTETGAQWFDPKAVRQPGVLHLFCFPYAGGSGQVFRAWQRFFSREIRLLPVHLPGRAQRINEPAFKQFKPLVEELTDAMVHYLPEPFAFWGHSMGALIGFEVARALRRKGCRGPCALIVSGRTAPQLIDSDPSLSGLSDEELIAKLKDLNGTAKELLANLELIKVFLPIIRTDFEMIETYVYEHEKPLTCPIYAYGGTEDVTVTAEGLRAWQEQTSLKCEIRRFHGDHFFIHSSIQSIAAAVQNDLFVA